MAKVKLYNSSEEYNTYYFKCHAGHWHYIRARVEKKNPEEKGIWGFNGNIDEPTFIPSVNETSGIYMQEFKSRDDFKDDNDRAEYLKFLETNSYKCHFVITKGTIYYCGDCSSEFKNQTLPMLDLPEDEYGK